MYRYNYVFFDNGSAINGKKDVNNYYYICTEDLQKINDIRVVSYPMDYTCGFKHILFSIYNHLTINHGGGLFNQLLYPFYFKNDFSENRPLCFIVYGYYITPEYLRYLRKTYTDCKIVKIHRDLYTNWRRKNPLFTDYDMRTLFDLSLSYDENEAHKYGMLHFNEFESRIEVPKSQQYPLSDVFFAGHAKDRLEILLSIYDELSMKGLRCQYYLTGVSKKKRVSKPGITYGTNPISYRDILYYSVNSRSILEINQSNAVGYTSRFLEAVMYNKKLISNNITIKKSKFYNPMYIQCFSNINEIDVNNILNDSIVVDYKYNDEFSPKNLITQIDEALS